MEISDIIDGLNARKAATGLTNQQISDESKVPKSTVDKILSGRVDNPTIKTLLDIAGAVGYNLGGQPGSAESADGYDSPYIRHIIAMYESQLAAQERQYNRATAEKDRWIRTLAVIIAILGAGIFSVLLIDMTNPEFGWIRHDTDPFALVIVVIIALICIAGVLLYKKTKE